MYYACFELFLLSVGLFQTLVSDLFKAELNTMNMIFYVSIPVSYVDIKKLQSWDLDLRGCSPSPVMSVRSFSITLGFTGTSQPTLAGCSCCLSCPVAA